MNNLKMLRDNVCIRLRPETSTNIIIPETSKDVEPCNAEVLFAGPECEVETGDTVLVAPQHKYTQEAKMLAETQFDGDENVVVIKEEDILVVYDEE